MPDPSSLVGRTISHYRILEPIGAGGMGEVLLAEDTTLRRKVALKLLPKVFHGDPDRRARFLQEARAAAAVDHPNVGVVFEVGEADGRAFIAMEYVRGRSLRQVLCGGPLPAGRALELAVEIADGLARAHARGVVHRDLKPENVLVTEDGRAKVIDFGLAKLIESSASVASDGSTGQATVDTEASTHASLHTERGAVLGTLVYMSPEQAKGEHVDARTDLFSFGVLLYEMLSGKSPFRRPSPAETMSAILHHEPPALALPALSAPSATVALGRLLARALAKEPDSRYASMPELLRDLRPLRDGARSTDMLATTLSPGSASRRRRRAALAALVLALAAAAAGVVLTRGRTGVAGRAAAPARVAPPGIGAAGRPAVAVLSFEDHTGSPEFHWLAQGLPSMLLTGLAQTPGLDVVSSERIATVLKQLGRDQLATVDRAIAAEVARKAGAGAVVLGSIFRAGDQIRIDVRLEDLASGRVLAARSVRGADVFPLVDDLTERVRATLSVPDAAGGAKGIAIVGGGSPEVYRLYVEGLDAERNQRSAASRRLLEEALSREPTFAAAHLVLARTLEYIDPAASAEHLAQALAHADRLPERQQILARAMKALRDDRPDDAVLELEALLARFPDDEDAYLLVNAPLWDAGRREESVATLERGVRDIPASGPLRNALAGGYAGLGRYDEALRELESYERLLPREPNPLDSQGEILLLMGEPERALARYDRALVVDPEFVQAHGGRAWSLGMLGRLPEALAAAETFAERGRATGFPPFVSAVGRAFFLSRLGRYREAEAALAGTRAADPQAAADATAVLLALERGRDGEAVARARAAADRIATVPYLSVRRLVGAAVHALGGVAEARRGNFEQAGRQLEAARRTGAPDREAWVIPALEAEIALARGDLAAAEAAMARGEPEQKARFGSGLLHVDVLFNQLPFRDARARLTAARGDLPGAAALYAALNTPARESKWTAVLEPRYVLAAARLLDRSGERDQARAEYARFLELWKDADPGLPETAEARRRVTALAR